MIEGTDLVVLSHLRWNFVYQRPQHILSRLAKSLRVVFIEEPIQDLTAVPHFKISRPQENVLVVQPHTPLPSSGFAEDQLAAIQPLLKDLITEQNIGRHLAWFYTPMALPLLDELDPELVI